MSPPGQPMLWEVLLPGYVGDGSDSHLKKWGMAFDEDSVRRVFPGAAVAELPEVLREFIVKHRDFGIGRKPIEDTGESSGTTLIQRQEACIAQLLPIYAKWVMRNVGKPNGRWSGFGMDLGGLRSGILHKHRRELMRVGFSKAEANQSADDCRDMAHLRTFARD